MGPILLDGPIFDKHLFVDHTHLTVDGGHLLALNLLRELNVRLQDVPATGTLLYPEEIDRTLVWSGEPGIRTAARGRRISPIPGESL